MNRETLIRYAQIKIEIKRLEEELDMLQPAVEQDVREQIDPKKEKEYVSLPELQGIGKYGLVKARPKYEFTQAVKDIEINLKEQKEEEIALGKAVDLNEGKYEMRFITAKE